MRFIWANFDGILELNGEVEFPQDKVLVLYGANLQGKTNLINAIRFTFLREAKRGRKRTKYDDWALPTRQEVISDGKANIDVVFEHAGEYYRLHREVLCFVVQNKGPLDYRDPETYFRKTYFTAGLTNLIGAVLSKLAGKEKGNTVIQIQTPFGGGKTHALLALYHIFKHGDKIARFDVVKKILKESIVDTSLKRKLLSL
jgi:ABC-type molybdate transport system ATPase subunit